MTGTLNLLHLRKADSLLVESTIAKFPQLPSQFTKISTSTRSEIWEAKIEVLCMIHLENPLIRNKETKCQLNSRGIAKNCTLKFWKKGKKLSQNSCKANEKS